MIYTTATFKISCLQRSNSILFFLVFCLFFSIFLSTRLLLATNYYVDATNGLDTNAGTQTNLAWKTINKVNNSSFQPGDNIFFRRGKVWHESLTIPSSGNASQPITFGAYGAGAKPLFVGTYGDSPIPTQWQQVQGNIYKTTQPSWNNDPGLLVYKGIAKPAITTLQFNSSVPGALNQGAILLQKDTHYTNLWVTSTTVNTVSGITFFDIYENENIYVRQLNASGWEQDWPNPLGTPTIVTNLNSLTEPGHWYWNESDKSIYLYADANPNGIDVKLGRLTIGINSARNNFIIIRNIAVHGFKQAGVLITGTKNSIVQNMLVSSTGANGYKCGILINNSRDNLVQNNTVKSSLRVGIAIYAVNAMPVSHGNTVSGNTVLNSGSTGISLNTDGQLIANTVENNIIRNNTVLNSNTLSYDSAGIYTLFVGGGNIIDSNTIRNGGSNELRSAGIMVEGGNESVIKPLTIKNNTIENNSLAGIAVSGKEHQITGNTIRNNGVQSWDNAQVVFFASFGANASNCTVTNNTMEAGNNQILLSVLNGYGSGSPPHTINHNTYCSTNPAPFCWSGWTCNNPVDFDSWKINSGHDTASTFFGGSCHKPSPGKNLTGILYLLLK